MNLIESFLSNTAKEKFSEFQAGIIEGLLLLIPRAKEEVLLLLLESLALAIQINEQGMIPIECTISNALVSVWNQCSQGNFKLTRYCNDGRYFGYIHLSFIKQIYICFISN